MMLEYVWMVGEFFIGYTGRLDRQQWTIVFFAALVIGFFFTRGFGSRSNY
jgi:hypothetical protein